MLWLVVLLALAMVTAVTCWWSLAVAEAVYGHPVGRGLFKRLSAKQVERRFLPNDIRELDEAFSRLLRSDIAER
jgi:hypothetical protein